MSQRRHRGFQLAASRKKVHSQKITLHVNTSGKSRAVYHKLEFRSIYVNFAMLRAAVVESCRRSICRIVDLGGFMQLL